VCIYNIIYIYIYYSTIYRCFNRWTVYVLRSTKFETESTRYIRIVLYVLQRIRRTILLLAIMLYNRRLQYEILLFIIINDIVHFPCSVIIRWHRYISQWNVAKNVFFQIFNNGISKIILSLLIIGIYLNNHNKPYNIRIHY
jgi:hypothetical protein